MPLGTGSADGAIGVLASHHFTDQAAAFQEMARVPDRGPTVAFTFDPRESAAFWFTEYFPSLGTAAAAMFPPLVDVQKLLAQATGQAAMVTPFPLPPDLQDGFAAACWRRPEAYLAAGVRAAISAFALADPVAVTAGVERLAADLASGAWDARFHSLRTATVFDAGYRIVHSYADHSG